MLEDNLIKHITTRSAAAFAERSIRTLRDGVNVRLDALGLAKSRWWKMLPFVVNQYNTTFHTTTEVTPNDAAQLDWDKPGGRQAIIRIRDTTADKAHFDLKYPLIGVGDRVKILRKPGKYGDFKSHFVAWSEATYKVEEITYDSGNPVFKLEDRSKRLRLHDIFKVDGVEKAPKLKLKGKQEIAAQLRRKRPPPPSVEEPPAEVPEPVRTKPRLRVKTPDPDRAQEAAVSAVEIAVARVNPRLNVKTVDPKWNALPIESRGLRRRTKTYDASWHQNKLHPLSDQLFI